MSTETKILRGFMNLDDPKDTFPVGHHKEARNGIFRGSSIIKFECIRGNQKITNTELKIINR